MNRTIMHLVAAMAVGGGFALACGGRLDAVRGSGGAAGHNGVAGEKAGRTPGAGGTAPGDIPSTGGAGATSGGTIAGTTSGGSIAAGGESNEPSGGDAGAGTGGAPLPLPGPCDIYRDWGQPCVAAYSTVRRILSTYQGPLYQIRSDSSAENTGSGGQTHDVGQTPDGFADAGAVDAACVQTICTVSLLYDQSGQGNHLPVAKAGIPFGGPTAPLDDFESSATHETLSVAGHEVHSLYMEPRQGYRLASVGEGMPRGEEPQGMYLLADGTRAADGCCWEFGNVPRSPSRFSDSTALLFGNVVAGVGSGEGPWFMADFRAGIWAGSSQVAYAGGSAAGFSANPNNPSLAVKFALGFLKASPDDWALRMADASTASSLTTAYEGPLPKPRYDDGGITLGVGTDNNNASWGTFYEGAIVAGWPGEDTESAILRNIQAVGYGK
jgi:non-reducing end alpha-L-arabinofuranosidase